MKNNETKYQNIKFTKGIITLILLGYVIIPGLLIWGIIAIIKAPIKEIGLFQSQSMKILFLLPMSIFLFWFLTSISGTIIGRLKGKKDIDNENKMIKNTNPYIYFRELPNNFGIGITTLLFDSKIENYKDIIAVILDLCAKKYLSLTKINDGYHIKVLKGIDESLLDNEKYVLSLILSGNIKDIDYQKWFNYCLQDGTNLGIYYHKEMDIKYESDKLLPDPKKDKKVLFIVNIIISIIVFIISTIAQYNLLTKADSNFIAPPSFLLIISMFIALIISGFALLICYTILKPFTLSIATAYTAGIRMSKQSMETNYKYAMNNHLIRTDKGIEELHKLISFKNFINDFGDFVDKKPEEVVLWDRYLSYAQVFGLTKEIMKTGYKQLVDNASFKIDDIDNITINNIEIDK